MKLIITDEAGHEAARLAFKSTSEVTEIELNKIDAFIVQHNNYDPWYRTSFEDTIKRIMEDLVERSSKDLGKKLSLIFMTNDTSIRGVDAKYMREAGWVRR